MTELEQEKYNTLKNILLSDFEQILQSKDFATLAYIQNNVSQYILTTLAKSSKVFVKVKKSGITEQIAKLDKLFASFDD